VLALVGGAAYGFGSAAKSAVGAVGKGAEDVLKDPSLMEELGALKAGGEKVTLEDVVMVTKTKDGRLVWLEKGNRGSGLQHIEVHTGQFADVGVGKDQIPALLQKELSEGRVVGYQGSGTTRPIYEVEFNGRQIKVAITIGDNGYIVGANPRTK
jgi:hypothetical protein